MRLVTLVLLCLGAAVIAEELEEGKTPPTVVLEGKAGGLVDGPAWKSESLRGKMTILFYVDPDERDMNEHVGKALEAKRFPDEHFSSVAVINMDATILPNFILDRLLARKQKQYPRSVYVRDKDTVLVKKWGLNNNSYDIVLFDENGIVKLVGKGKMAQDTLDRLLQLIDEGVKRLSAN